MKKVFTCGNGGVIVRKCLLGRYVELTQIKPPLGYVGYIGDGDLEGKEELYSVKIKKESLQSLKDELIRIDSPVVLEFEDFILDFSDFKEKSLKIILRAVEDVLRGHSQLALAC